MHRRRFLQSAGAVSLLLWTPRAVLAADRPRVLLLVELAGGNDGLNTVIPYADPAYARLRPGLAVARDRVLPLGGNLGLHPGLDPLMSAWTAGQLAVALGVGYDDPNRSHFRSIEIWETASKSDEYLTEGWVARAAPDLPGAGAVTDLIVVGDQDEGPMAGGRQDAVVIQDPDRLANQIRSLRAPSVQTDNPALRHILEIQSELVAAGGALTGHLPQAPAGIDFGRTPFGRSLSVAARVIASDIHTAAVKVSLDGFDTHSAQTFRHERLMTELGSGLAAFRQAMIAAGTWDRVLVMTYSEFGRRAGQNAGGGTDHGTAAPHFLMGGRLVGGFYGQYPSLTELSTGDLIHSTDFRSLYATVTRRWWGLSTGDYGPYAPLDCIRA